MLHRITTGNLAEVQARLEGEPDPGGLVEELQENYRPKYADRQRLTVYGFYILKEGRLAGLSLLEGDSWPDARGSTGADSWPGRAVESTH